MTQLREVEDSETPTQPLAAAAIARYTAPGELIIDLGCGSGHALIEAIRADRLAIGIERSRRLAEEAREAVARATAHGGPGFAAVVVGELADVPKLVGPDSLGKASLVLVDMARAGVLGKHARGDAGEGVERFVTVLEVCRALLRRGGHVLVSVQRDLSDEIVRTAAATPTFAVTEDRHDTAEPGAFREQVSAIVMRYAAANT